jgi:hypothetical protein
MVFNLCLASQERTLPWTASSDSSSNPSCNCSLIEYYATMHENDHPWQSCCTNPLPLPLPFAVTEITKPQTPKINHNNRSYQSWGVQGHKRLRYHMPLWPLLWQSIHLPTPAGIFENILSWRAATSPHEGGSPNVDIPCTCLSMTLTRGIIQTLFAPHNTSQGS